jgi:hypothetical protein
VTLTFLPGLGVDAAMLEEIIREALEPRARAADYEEIADARESEGPLNPSAHEVMERKRKDAQSRQKAAHEKDVAARRKHEKERLVKEKEKKLASSSAARERGLDIGAHAEKWADEERGDASKGSHWGGGRSKRISQAGPQQQSSQLHRSSSSK